MRAAVRTCSHVAFEIPSCKHLIMVAEGLRSPEVQLSCVAACLSCIHISCVGHRACASIESLLTSQHRAQTDACQRYTDCNL